MNNPSIVFLALSSCLGDTIRPRITGSRRRNGTYEQAYLRTMTYSGPASSEHIEMETMLNERDRDPGDEP